MPNLADRRRVRLSKLSNKGGGLPTPGGLGAGIAYKDGQLQIVDSAALYTNMIVHPDGVNPSDTMDFLFTTATNRTEKGVEFLAVYYNDGPGSLQVFDWSCSPDYPCQDGQTGPSYQLLLPLSDLQCNMTQMVDGACSLHTTVYYVNESTKLDNGNPPLLIMAILHYGKIWYISGTTVMTDGM